MAANTGAAGSFAIGSANPIVEGATTGVLLDILSENIGATKTFIDGNGMKGTLARHLNRTALGPIAVGGSFSFNPTSSDLACALPYFFGTPVATTTYALAQTPANFVIQKKTGGSGNRVFTYATNYSSAITFSGSYGSLLRCDVGVVGLTEAVGSSFPSFTANYANSVFPFSGLALTIGGSSYNVFDFSLTVDWGVGVQQVNSRTATAVFPTDRNVSISLSIPEADVLRATLEDTSLEVIATFTAASGSESLVFTMPAVRFTVGAPSMGDRGEIRHQLTGQAFRNSSSLELVTTLDSTP